MNRIVIIATLILLPSLSSSDDRYQRKFLNTGPSLFSEEVIYPSTEIIHTLATKCKARITCPDGSRLECSASGSSPNCFSGRDTLGYKFVSCDDEIGSPPPAIRQFCTTKD